MQYPTPVLLVVAAEDLFSSEVDWLHRIDAVARHATAYPPGSVALQLRPRVARPPLDTDAGKQLASKLRDVLDAADAAHRVPVYASARHPWLVADRHWRLHVPEAQLQSPRPATIDAWSASVHSAASARRAARASAHLLVVAPVFTPDWKPAQAIGLDGLKQIVEACEVPVLALGGIKPQHVAACLGVGAQGVAVASGILLAPDMASAMRAFAEGLGVRSNH